MSINVYKQAEKEMRTLRHFVDTLKGITSIEEAMNEAGSLQRVIDAKKAEVAALDADAARHAEKIATTETECVGLRSQAAAKAQAILVSAESEAQATAQIIVAEASKLAEEAQAAAMKVGDAVVVANKEAERIVAEAHGEAQRLIDGAQGEGARRVADADSKAAAATVTASAAAEQVAKARTLLDQITTATAEKQAERDSLQADIDRLKAKFA